MNNKIIKYLEWVAESAKVNEASTVHKFGNGIRYMNDRDDVYISIADVAKYLLTNVDDIEPIGVNKENLDDFVTFLIDETIG